MGDPLGAPGWALARAVSTRSKQRSPAADVDGLCGRQRGTTIRRKVILLLMQLPSDDGSRMSAGLRASAFAFRHQAGGGRLDVGLQAREEGLDLEAGRDRIEDLDRDRSGIAQELAARPEQPGIERDRDARRDALGIKMRDAVFVFRLGARRPARAL